MRLFENRDCMEGMAEYPDNHFDLAIVDPPYSVGASDGKFGRGGLGGNGYSPSPINKNLHHYKQHNARPTQAYFKELFRVSRQQIIWGSNYYNQHLPNSGAVVWDKVKDCNPVLSDCEIAFQSINEMVKICRIQWFGFAKSKGGLLAGEKGIIHPNQKPVSLYRWLLENYAKPGDLILDTHVGSASSLIACEALGFDYVGYELDADYYAAAVKRIEDWRAMPLFDNAPDNEQLNLL